MSAAMPAELVSTRFEDVLSWSVPAQRPNIRPVPVPQMRQISRRNLLTRTVDPVLQMDIRVRTDADNDRTSRAAWLCGASRSRGQRLDTDRVTAGSESTEASSGGR